VPTGHKRLPGITYGIEFPQRFPQRTDALPKSAAVSR
jgi:hypothetical protein